MIHRIVVMGGLALAGALAGCGQGGERIVDAGEAARHAEAERAYVSPAAALATATAAGPRTRHPWPVTVLSIGHTGASYQNYGGSPYFHHGLDIRADAGSEVVAAAGGKVVNIENYVRGDDAYWEVAILDDEGFLWQYHHVERRSIPRAIHDALASGQPIAAGTKIGEVYFWGVTTFGERYHHIHLNVLAGDRRYRDPFDFLAPLADPDAPQFVDVGLLKNGRRVDGTTVSGAYTVYAQVHDLIRHQRFVVPPHRLSYSVDGGDERIVWDFATLPGGASNTAFVDKLFVPSLTCGNYTCRKLTLDLGFDTAGTRPFTTERGAHQVEIVARDYAGNEARKTFQWTVQ